MARAAIPADRRITPAEAGEVAAAYKRLREHALEVWKRTGWGTAEEFDAEVPLLIREPSDGRMEVRIGGNPPSPKATVDEGLRAIVLLRQLEAWAGGLQEAYELQARMEANAKAKAEAAAKPRAGFDPT